MPKLSFGFTTAPIDVEDNDKLVDFAKQTANDFMNYDVNETVDSNQAKSKRAVDLAEKALEVAKTYDNVDIKVDGVDYLERPEEMIGPRPFDTCYFRLNEMVIRNRYTYNIRKEAYGTSVYEIRNRPTLKLNGEFQSSAIVGYVAVAVVE